MHTEISHPFIQHKLTILRDIKTSDKEFRELASEITMLLAYEALKHVPVAPIEIETPLTKMSGQKVSCDVVVVPILRAGVGMLNGILTLIPTARVGFMGLYRHPETKEPVEYYEKLPSATDNALALVIDPMLATGGSLAAAITMLKGQGFKNIVVIAIIAAPEGIEAVESVHDDVQIYTANIDSHLDDHKYIVPGLGDAGDRLFGTR